jgi:hypothetical protein
MENSEAQDKVINLGKLFVNELKLEPGVDTFSRWMAHYLAEKISVAEQSEGREKEIAEKECFEVILKLWQHRNSLPSSRRPFQSFEPILELLSKLNPDKEETYFYHAMRNQELSELETDNFDYKSVEKWANISEEIDKTARIWIEYALAQAAKNAKNERTKEWIENAIGLSDSEDTEIINILLNINPSIGHDNFDEVGFSKKYDIERLKKRISQLQKFSQLNEFLLKSYKSELDKYLEK